jgi:transposase
MGTTVQLGDGEESAVSVHRRRRFWSLEEKRRIVAESLEPGASASRVARRHDLNTNMLFTWRRRLGGVGVSSPRPVSFVPAAITSEAGEAARAGAGGRMEIVLASGARVIVGMDVEEAALARVIRVLAQQR